MLKQQLGGLQTCIRGGRHRARETGTEHAAGQSERVGRCDRAASRNCCFSVLSVRGRTSCGGQSVTWDCAARAVRTGQSDFCRGSSGGRDSIAVDSRCPLPPGQLAPAGCEVERTSPGRAVHRARGPPGGLGDPARGQEQGCWVSACHQDGPKMVLKFHDLEREKGLDTFAQVISGSICPKWQPARSAGPFHQSVMQGNNSRALSRVPLRHTVIMGGENP